jgi:nucleotide-binding universal stress UspA family protein
MFKHILVPLDGSQLAEQALPIAARLARASGGTITLLRVNEMLASFIPSLSPAPEVTQDLVDADLTASSIYLEEIAKNDLLRDIPTQITVTIGSVATVILSTVEAEHYDLIVMNSHGRTGFARWMLGSVAEKVSRRSLVPVLMIRQSSSSHTHTITRGEADFRMLVPLDGSPLAEAAIAPTVELVKALSPSRKGALHLTQIVVMPDAEQSFSSEKEAIVQHAKDYLADVSGRLQEGYNAAIAPDQQIEFTWSVSIDDDIASGIVRVAEDGENIEGVAAFGKCDMIAMATHGRSGIQRWAMGSITERVLHATRLPILIVRPTSLATIPTLVEVSPPQGIHKHSMKEREKQWQSS